MLGSTFITNAENILLERLATLGGEYTAWRMAVLKGSHMARPHRRMIELRESQLAVADIITPYEMSAYFCKDGDVIFLFRNLLRNSVPVLHDALRALLPYLDPKNIDFDAFFTLYDLEISLNALMDMVQRKIVAKTLHPGVEDLRPYQWDAALFAEAATQRDTRYTKLVHVVEDNALFRQLAKDVLVVHYAIALSVNGYDAMEFYNAHAPDIMFLDIDIPRIDGMAVLRTLISADPKAAIIMFSAKSQPDTLKQAMTMGAKGFVTKPFTAETMLNYAKQASAG